MGECVEPRCTRPAVKTWQGRKICEDHYDQYREQWEQAMRDIGD